MTQELGAKLKKIRLQKGISLEEVHKKTKVHINILKAIEGDSLTNLSPVYLKSFSKIYCRYLGVPEEECDIQAKPVPPKPRPEPQPKPGTPQPAAKKDQKPQVPAQPNIALKKARELSGLLPKLPWKRIAVVGVAVVLLFWTVSGISKFARSRPKRPPKKIETVVKKEGPKPAQPSEKPKARPAKKTAEKEPEQAAPAAPKTPVSDDIRLGIRAKENCYLVLKVDGRTVFQRVLARGRYESWRAKDKIELSVANAAAVELEVNGQLFSKIGRKGQAIKNIVITKDGMRIP